ncbi:uncharacterized protein I303_105347 [Kwoniella dejecticola CBS 10117]|uniref:Polynucleotide 5'-hydroxyl-kinase GRC3 n=1 Tax=Kwoniella dejecticola CBS 10117 TaxID=1296121 RepID=A0AAJ8KSM4_9TREE
MSAIAARRAAALLASQNASPSSSIVSTPVKAKLPTPESEDETESVNEVALPESDAEPSTGSTSPPPSPPTNKKRKLRKSSPHQARYHTQSLNNRPTTPTVSQSSASKRTRRFSPSAPASLPEPGIQTESGSSIGDSDADIAEDDEEDEAADEVDGGRAQWSIPNTSANSTPGPSRAKNKSSLQVDPNNTSNFHPIDGVNVIKVSEEEIKALGSEGGSPGDGIVLSLSVDETIMIAGTYILTPLSGSLSISCCTLSPDGSSYPVFAPTSHPIPIISPCPLAKIHSLPLASKLKLPKGFKRTGSLLLIRENQCGIDGLRYGAVPGFAHIWLEEVGSWGLRGVHPVIGSFSTPVYPHITPPSWSDALSALIPPNQLEEYGEMEMLEPFIGLVKGPKRSGKSTFARAVLNNLLERYERVAWLECDLGQGEFSPGGVVGLWVLDKQVLGPSFTHPKNAYRSHCLGTYTPLTCPDEYIASLRHLMEIYKFDIQHSSSDSISPRSSSKINDNVPLVINTQGWVKGLGEELLRSIESICEPTHTFSFSSPYEDDLPEHIGGGWTTSPTYQIAPLPDVYGKISKQITLEPIPSSPLQARYTAADLRVLSIISYFHSSSSSDWSMNTDTKQEGVKWDFTKPLMAIPPWEVEYGPQKAIEKIWMIGEGSEGVVSEDLGIALNGAVAGLIEILEDSPDTDTETGGEKGVYVQGRALPRLDSINLLGMGLIRQITSDHSLIKWRLGQSQGDNKKWSYRITDSRFIRLSRQCGVEVVGGERRRFRKNIMRKGM